jgi:hypothetical protein
MEVIFGLLYAIVGIYVFTRLVKYYETKNQDGDPDGIDALTALFFAVFWIYWVPFYLLFGKSG